MTTSFYSIQEMRKMGFAALGENVLISRKASFYGIENISIGNNVRIDDFCILSGKITLGSYIHISAYTGIFSGKSGVTAADFVTISGRCNIYGKSDDYTGMAMTNPMVPEALLQITDAPVVFGRHSILGCACTVLPGVKLAEGTAVGSMSLLREDTRPWTMYAGIPAKEIHPRKRCPLELEKLVESFSK